MTNLELLRNEYSQLCEEFYRASDCMHSIGRKIRIKRKEIEEFESRAIFKYNRERYKVIYEELDKPHRSLLLRDLRNGIFVIKINSRLTEKEKKKELHIMLTRKKWLKYF